MNMNGNHGMVHQAAGVLHQRKGITVEEALASLQAQADATKRDIIDVAREVVDSTTEDADEA